MSINPVKFNIFAPSMQGIKGINPVQKKPTEPEGGIEAGAKPFAQKNGPNGYGVGLVNSGLENLSYNLPNGKKSICNTIGIC